MSKKAEIISHKSILYIFDGVGIKREEFDTVLKTKDNYRLDVKSFTVKDYPEYSYKFSYYCHCDEPFYSCVDYSFIANPDYEELAFSKFINIIKHDTFLKIENLKRMIEANREKIINYEHIMNELKIK